MWAHLVAVRAPVVGVILPPVDEAPAAAVAPDVAPLGADVVAAEPRVLHAARQPHLHSIHGVSQAMIYYIMNRYFLLAHHVAVLLGAGHADQLPPLGAGALQPGRLPPHLQNAQ